MGAAAAPEDRGQLWEHLVLEHLQERFANQPICYWRDKQGREVDFVLAHRRDEVDAIECKWDPGAFYWKIIASLTPGHLTRGAH